MSQKRMQGSHESLSVNTRCGTAGLSHGHFVQRSGTNPFDWRFSSVVRDYKPWSAVSALSYSMRSTYHRIRRLTTGKESIDACLGGIAEAYQKKRPGSMRRQLLRIVDGWTAPYSTINTIRDAMFTFLRISKTGL